jgi:hypothetical protein
MHCWNVLPNGEHLDLTSDQFDYPYELGSPVDREPVVNHTGVNTAIDSSQHESPNTSPSTRTASPGSSRLCLG